MIGTAELDKELQKTVMTILRDKDTEKLNKKEDLELDAEELKKHLDFVIKEVKKQE